MDELINVRAGVSNQKMNICVITSSFPINDADPMGGFAYDFCLELAKTNKVTVITQKRTGNYQINKNLNLIVFDWAGKDAALAELNFFNIRHLFYVFSFFINGEKAIRNYARQNKVDYCFALWALPSGIGAYYLRSRFKVPYDVWCLGSDIWDHKNNQVTNPFLKAILKTAKNVYADGFNFAEEVKEFSNRECKFLPTSQKLPVHSTLNKPLEVASKTFIFIGRYHPNKGPDVLIEAISILPEEINKNSRFVFYGEGVLKKSMEDRVAELNLKNVIINDLVDKNEIFKVFSESHFIIIPSRFDSIPVILSDALQGNTPMIGAITGDLGDVIKDYQLGYTFERENTLELSRVIEKAFYDKKENYLESINKAKAIFSVEGAVKEFVNNIKI